MKKLPLGFIILVIPLLLSFSDTPLFESEWTIAKNSKVDRRVLEDTAGDSTGSFLVVLRRQADTGRIASEPGVESHGARVYHALRHVADLSQPGVVAYLESLEVEYRPYWIVNAVAIKGSRTAVEALAARSDVLAIESNRPFQVPLALPARPSPETADGIEWNIKWVRAPEVWDAGNRGENSVYANADTGVQWDHPALKSQYRGWDGENADHNYSWWDAIQADLNGDGINSCGFRSLEPCDDHGHGTHTTGTGVGSDGSGNHIGIAPGAKWIACRNMEDGFGQPSTYLECLQFFLAPTDLNGADPDPSKRPDVIANSYSCPPSEGCSANVLQEAMQNLRAAGTVLAVSAGNSGPLCATVNAPPGLEESALTVGATGYQSDTIAGFSSRGPVTADGSNRLKPDLVAPGVGIRSSTLNGGYSYLQGTSMSSPHVAGAVALLWSAFPDLRGEVDVMEAALMMAAKSLPSSQSCGGDGPDEVPNHVYGYGQLDIFAAYQFLASGQKPEITPTPSGTPDSQLNYFLPLFVHHSR